MERESVGSQTNLQTGIQRKEQPAPRPGGAVILGVLLVGIFAGVQFSQYGLHHSRQVVLAILVVVALVLKLLPYLFHWTVGTIDLVQIFSPEFEQRIRARYQSESSQIIDLGFDQQFFAGDSTSVFRLILIFPAIVVFHMWRNRVPMTVKDGTTLLTGNPVFISRDKSAYAHPNSLGFTFHTAFQDGTLLVSKNFGSASGYIPAIVGNVCRAAGIGDTWASHQQRLQELVAQGRQVDRQSSFQSYREMVLKEQTRP
ncbi:MAG: hypothetical protein ABSG00_06050 [Terracidiphilus sp.]|jgi:hypothetical protein